MPEFYANANNFVQMVIIVGVVSTLLIILQVIMLLMGFGDDGDISDLGDASDIGDVGDLADAVDAGDFELDSFSDLAGLKLITIRGVIIFFAAASWTYLLIFSNNGTHIVSLVCGIIVGIIAMILFAYAMKKMTQFQEEGNININNSLGKIGTVYLRIPPKKSGSGKINVLIQERLTEFDAITDDENGIPTGAEVEILKSINNVLLVKKIND